MRRSVVDRHERTSAELRNPIARAFERQFGDSLKLPVLPPRTESHPSFAPNAAVLYENVRELLPGDSEASDVGTPHYYEALLDKAFWDTENCERLSFVLGPTGCGKSTLVDYYLRCYCPNLGIHKEEFKKKVIIDIDVLNLQTVEDLTHNLFLVMQHRIRERCLEKGYDIDAAIRRRPNPENVRHWVHEALSIISNEVRSGHAPFRYIVLVIDNLDQSPIKVQTRAIRIVDEWLRAQGLVSFFHVFIPLWPFTLVNIRNSGYDPLPPHNIVRLGRIRGSLPIEKRMDRLRNAVHNSGTISVSGGGRGDQAISNRDCVQYLKDVQAHAAAFILPLMHRLTNGNLRIQQSLWEALVSGQVAYANWSFDQQPVTQFGTRNRLRQRYQMIDAMLTGTSDHFDSANTRLLNVFASVRPARSCRDLLICSHTLYLLSMGYSSRRELIDILRGLGYQENKIELVLSALQRANGFHEAFVDGDDVGFDMHHETIDEYRSLLREPAYIDNAAMVTPIEDTWSEGMTLTSSFRRDEFAKRVRTSLRFIGQVRVDETDFTTLALCSEGTDRAKFSRVLHDLELPRMARDMALSYKRRLRRLRRTGYLDGVAEIDDAWWRGVLASEIFSWAEGASEFLRPVGTA